MERCEDWVTRYRSQQPWTNGRWGTGLKEVFLNSPICLRDPVVVAAEKEVRAACRAASRFDLISDMEPSWSS